MKSALGIFFILVLKVPQFNTEGRGSLMVSISNINRTGKIYAALYSRCDDFPNSKFVVKSVSVECKKPCALQFESVPFGDYAIAVYQDENKNEKLDTGMFGIPSEPFAFSNNFRPRFGGPSFEKCHFVFSKDKQNVSIRLINSLFKND